VVTSPLKSRPPVQRAALAIVRRYPAAWRDRYESEVDGLIEDSSLTWRDVAELVRGMLTERARELVESDEHPKRTAFVLWSLRWVFGAAFIGSVFATAATLRSVVGTLSDGMAISASVGLFVLIIGFFIVLWRIRTGPPFGPQAPYPAWAAFTMLPIFFALLATLAWAGGMPVKADSSLLPGWLAYLPQGYNWLWCGAVAVGLAGALLPGRELLHIFSRLAGSERGIRSAQQLVDGCHGMIAKGVPSPLNEAEAALTKAKRFREDAFERLQALGYRARFRPVDGGPRTEVSPMERGGTAPGKS
jgi:hypothetical protein